jgi:hypothetical protein
MRFQPSGHRAGQLFRESFARAANARENPLTRPDELEYPFICFSRDNSVSVASSPAEFHSCNALAWFRNRYFDDLLVFDAAAAPYRVRSARLATPLHGWRRLLARARNRELVVVLELEYLGEASLDRAKQTAIDWLHRAPDFWEAAYDISEWERIVSQAPNMEALCAAFT